MSRLRKALLKVGAITVAPDGRLVPCGVPVARHPGAGNTTGAGSCNSAAIFHGTQLLLADADDVTVYNSNNPQERKTA